MLIAAPKFAVGHEREVVKPFITPGEARNTEWRGMTDCNPAQNLPLENEVACGRIGRDFFLKKNIKVSHYYYFLNGEDTGYIKGKI